MKQILKNRTLSIITVTPMSLCQYKNALGIPGEGFHKHVAGIAIGDVIGTVAIAAGISAWTKYPFWIVFVCILLLAMFLHWIFCVPTAVNSLVGLI